jgi:hypothetical protein
VGLSRKRHADIFSAIAMSVLSAIVVSCVYTIITSTQATNSAAGTSKRQDEQSINVLTYRLKKVNERSIVIDKS